MMRVGAFPEGRSINQNKRTNVLCILQHVIFILNIKDLNHDQTKKYFI